MWKRICIHQLLTVSPIRQAGEHDVLSAVLKWGEHQLVRRMEDRGGYIVWRWSTGLDIGYVPAGPHAFLRLSGQFGPLQLIFHWPEGPVDFFFFF